MLPWREAGRHIEGVLPLPGECSRDARAGARERGMLGDAALPGALVNTPGHIGMRWMNAWGVHAGT